MSDHRNVGVTGVKGERAGGNAPGPSPQRIQREARFSCKAGRPAETFYIDRKISIPPVEGESPAATARRFETTARGYTKSILGCADVKYEGILPSAEERGAGRQRRDVPKVDDAPLDSCIDAGTGKLKSMCKR